MATGKITKISVDALTPPASGKEFLWDSKLTGFGVYISPKGRRVYVVQYRSASDQKRYTIGPHGPWTPEKARQRASELLLKVYQGIDPLAEKRAKRKAAQVDDSLRFSKFAETYLSRLVDGVQRQGKRVRRTYELHLIPRFGDTPINKITPADILALLDELSLRSRGAALHTYKILRPMFTFAASRGAITHHPFQNVRKPKDFDPRQRHLQDWEIQRVWEAAADMGDHPGGALTHMILLTGQRCLEVAGMSWAEIDLQRREWLIPGTRAKNGKPHLVPLSDFLVEYLDVHWPVAERRGLLFPGVRGDKPIAGFPAFRELLYRYVDRRVALAIEAGQDPARNAIARFHYHDLRRTVSSACARMKVPREHTEALLNHRSGRTKLIDTYQVYDFYDEKAATLDLWHRQLQNLLERADAWPGGRDLPLLVMRNKWKGRRGITA